MKFLTVACIVLIALIAVSFVFYTRLTNNIIKDQEREISALKREKAYLEKTIKRLSQRKAVKVENITINTDPDYIPSYPSREVF